MQALARFVRQRGELLKTNGGVDEVAQDEACSFWLAIQEQSSGFVEQDLCKRCIGLHALNDGSTILRVCLSSQEYKYLRLLNACSHAEALAKIAKH